MFSSSNDWFFLAIWIYYGVQTCNYINDWKHKIILSESLIYNYPCDFNWPSGLKYVCCDKYIWNETLNKFIGLYVSNITCTCNSESWT